MTHWQRSHKEKILLTKTDSLQQMEKTCKLIFLEFSTGQQATVYWWNSSPWEAIRSPQLVEAGSWHWCWWLESPHCSCGSSRKTCWRCLGSSASLSCCLTGTLAKITGRGWKNRGWTSGYANWRSTIKTQQDETVHPLHLNICMPGCRSCFNKTAMC